MKILFYIYFLTYGGAERVTSIIASELAKRGYDVYVVVHKTSPNDYPVDSRVHIIEIPYINRLEDIENLRTIIKDIKPDVNIGVLPTYFEILLLANRGLNIPLVASDHNNLHWVPTHREEYIRHHLYNFADVITVLTENDKNFMTGQLNNMVVMNNPLSFPIIKKDEEVTRQKRVLCVGRLNAYYPKGFDWMLFIWSQISEKYPDWCLDIMGSGRECDFNTLQNMINNYEISDSVKLLGWNNNIYDLMKKYPIFALPSREEGFPCSLLEAMSQGCVPVSFSIHGNISEIITNKKDGFIVEDYSLNEFKRYLLLLMDNEELREQMSRNAIKSMKRFEPEKIADKWETMLTELVKNYKK